MNKKKFITIFDRAKNFHLVKDVGQLPYHMYKEYNYDSTLVTCNNDENYIYLKDEVKGLKINFIPKLKIFKINFGVLFYLIKNSKNIDVLHQFHIRNYTLFYAFIYKVLNKKGINYIKADADEKSLISRGYIIKSKYLKAVEKYVDILSFETSSIVELFKKQNPLLTTKIIKISNGIDEKYILETLSIKNLKYVQKENTIVYVARIGTYQKNTELFLNAIEKINLGNWTVHLIGEISDDFEEYVNKFFLRNKDLKDKIKFHGNITSRKEIYNYYIKSKIFCMSSRYEGFPLVYPEVLYFGNYIFTTDVSGAKDITSNGKYGMIIKNFDLDTYSKELEKLIKLFTNEFSLYNNIRKYAVENYTWQKIVTNLHNNIKER